MRAFTSIFAIAACAVLADASVIRKRQVGRDLTCYGNLQTSKQTVEALISSIDQVKADTLEMDLNNVNIAFDRLFQAASDSTNVCCYEAPARPEPVDSLVPAITEIGPELEKTLKSFEALVENDELDKSQLDSVASNVNNLFNVFSGAFECARRLIPVDNQAALDEETKKLGESVDKLKGDVKDAAKDAKGSDIPNKSSTDDASSDDASSDASKDDASKDDASKDDASKDDASKDAAA